MDLWVLNPAFIKKKQKKKQQLEKINYNKINVFKGFFFHRSIS